MEIQSDRHQVDGRGGIVEIQRSRANDNMYAEITASQADTYLYQDIDTAHSVPTVYTVKLRYAHRNGTINSNEKIQILVGAPGHEQPVEMTRIASDRGNKVGEKSTTVNAPNTDGWLGSWDTFQVRSWFPPVRTSAGSRSRRSAPSMASPAT